MRGVGRRMGRARRWGSLLLLSLGGLKLGLYIVGVVLDLILILFI